MRWKNEMFLYCMAALIFSLLIPGIGQAEVYFGAMGGYSIPNDLTDRTSQGAFPDMPLPDAGLGNSAMVGAKVGFYLPDYNWFGIETEGYFTDPKFSTVVPQGAQEVDANLQVITWGFNALFRYPGERFQPYVGVGGGLFFAELDTDLPGNDLSENWAPGFTFLGGFRGFVTNSLGIFVEYKYNQATFDLRTTRFGLPFGFEGTYKNNIIAAGLAWHFR